MATTPTRPAVLAPICLVLALAPAGACNKRRVEQPPPDESAQEVQAQASRPDPRLASADQDGGMANPHGGGMANPHGGGMANPPGGGDNPHAGTGGMGGMGGMGGGGGSTTEKTPDGRAVLGPMTAAVPKGWQEHPTTSGMRVAQWTAPGKAGEAELVVFYFGAGGAGGVEANLERWINQFEQPDGSPSSGKAKTEKKTVNGMPTTLVEVSGRYVATMSPGSAEKNDKPDHMLLGAIVETSAGPYYFKMVGPQATMTAARKSFDAFVASLKPATAAK